MEHQKNEILTVVIDDIGRDGEGIGRYEGYTLFVKDALCKDTVEAKLTKVKKNYAYARCERIVIPSPDRTTPFCDDHRRCGGCQIQALSYKAQLRFKENKVKNDLMRIAGLPEDRIDDAYDGIIGMDDPVRYRNKSQYPVGCTARGEIVAGFYAKRTHDIIPCRDCGIAPFENAKIVSVVVDHMRQYGIKPYDEKDGSGTIRHIVIRKGFATGQIMVCLVIKHSGKGSRDKEYIAGQKELIEKLDSIEGVTSVCISINNENTNVIMGKESVTIFGSNTIKDELLGKTFEISPESFFQVNPVQTEKLYTAAIEYADLSGNEEVWDICCGIGTISLCLADKAGSVHGLEIVPEAIEDAGKNAAANKVENVDFICADAAEYLYDHKDEIKADVIVVDPPRKGMEEKALSAICEVFPKRIVYVSCDSATLSRDIRYLAEKGYDLKKFTCVDMFPHSVHIETACLLER